MLFTTRRKVVEVPSPNVRCALRRAALPSALAMVLAGTLLGCTKNEPVKERSAEKPSAQPTVMAKVNGENITKADVDFFMERTFNRADNLNVNPEVRDKVLDSLIASRAMKQLVLEQLSAADIERIKQSARAYEEELYVKEYLQRNVTPTPVTTEMVQNYYESNPQEFGAETLRSFELVKAPAELNDDQRKKVLEKLAAIRSAANWAASAKAWQKELGLQYRQGQSRAGLLHRNLDQAMAQLNQGDTSQVLKVDGELHLVRVTEVMQTPPKSLAEVSGEIRKKLAPILLREAVKKASADARGRVEVVVGDDRHE